MVTLPFVAESAFTGLNSEVGQASFVLYISACGADASNLQLMFAGTPDAFQTNSFANTATIGTATGVSLRLRDVYSNILTPGVASTNIYPVFGSGPPRGATIVLNTAYVQNTTNTPTAGAFYASTILNIVY